MAAVDTEQPRRILVVDDRKSSRALLRRRLERRGYKVVEAENGQRGAEQFRTHRPQAVITDMRMPEGDGLELLRAIRRLADVPIYCITAYPHWESSAEAIKDGADEYFLWPRDVERLLKLLEARLDGQQRSVDRTRRQHRARLAAKQKAELEEWLERTGGNVSQVAEALRVDRKTVYARCRRLGIQLRAADPT